MRSAGNPLFGTQTQIGTLTTQGPLIPRHRRSPMTRKDSRNTSVLRSIAPLIAVLTVMFALAALAQVRGVTQASGSSHIVPVQPNVGAPLLVRERSLAGGATDVGHDPGTGSQRKRFGAGPADSGVPIFLPVVTYASGGQAPESIVVADVNGDGKPDLVVANQCQARPKCTNIGAVGVLLGNGDGTFQPTVAYVTGGVQALFAAVGDINGDGKPDIVVANYGSSTVGVLLGNGDGSFQPAVAYDSGGTQPISVAIVDVNSDGKPDLLVANCSNTCSNEGVVGVLLGKGDGTFQPAVAYDTGGVSARSVAVADVNGDGEPDMAVVNDRSETVGVLLGNGDGIFQTAVTYGFGGFFGLSVALGDVNGDGRPDLLVTEECGNVHSCPKGAVAVLLGHGDGTFGAAVAYGSGDNTFFIAVGDVNGDGKPDLVTANRCDQCPDGGTVSVLLGNGDGTFQSAAAYRSGGRFAVSVAVADLNGDGKTDVLVVNETTSSVGVLLNNVGAPPTTTALVSSVNPVATGQTVTYTATVTSESGGPLTGTVMFQDGAKITTVTLADGVASYNAKYKTIGTHRITATYSGELHKAAGSTSATLKEYVGLAPTTTTLTTSGSPSHVGQPVTFTATVKWTYGTVPDGELVTFFDGTTTIGTGTTASGVATFTTSLLTAKTHTIKATYSGDAKFKSSTGTVTQVVQP